ncbi:similar to Saccharomyces cerevisiae YMR066W SOV1 Mitochondrial protein of unknown function [Maudiozyma saulgeensis]|uniref:Uncharacterized protein n=1 Tax=Maudiozyma saulgeensis TaxID=1789683 RepID=A0A1X7RAD4_9SACH|nr:similar to Saccharomyces cerevisiae YMR066W SOV1 Mitochondrial protein of unknown function [Kazachstania saulgeensis]
MLRRCARSAAAVSVRWYRRPATVGANHIRSHIPQLKSNESEIFLVGKDQKDVEKNLEKLGFEQIDSDDSTGKTSFGDSLFLKYLKHYGTGFKSSNRNFNVLNSSFDKESSDKKLSLLFNYFLREADLEVRRLKNYTPEQINNLIETRSNEILDESMDSTDILEEFIVNDLTNEDKSQNYLIHTNFLLQILNNLLMDPNFKPSRDNISMDQLVEVFEFSKTIPVQHKRQQGIMCSGRLIYSVGNVRMDPVNESFYINSLVAFGHYNDAHKLFKSRKDTLKEKWWYTIGLNILLATNNLRGFKHLLNETDSMFPHSYPYLSMKVIKFSIKKFLRIDNLKMANEMTNRFLDIVELKGLNTNELRDEDSKFKMFHDENDANDYLNQIEIPNQHDFITIINYYTYKKNMSMVSYLFQKYLELPDKNMNYHDLILRTNLNLLKDFDLFKKLIITESSSKLTRANIKTLEKEFQKIIANYDTTDKVIQSLLFHNIEDLLSNRKLSAAIRNFINEKLNTDLDYAKSSTDIPIRDARQYHTLLETLLHSGKYDKAEEILLKLEQSYIENNKTNPIPKVSAHIYAIYLDHYWNLAIAKHKRFPLTDMDKKVDDILTRINTLKVPYNSKFIASLLRYYRSRKNLKICYRIINAIFETPNGSIHETEQTNFKSTLFHRRDINETLYTEIWKVYYNYYSNEITVNVPHNEIPVKKILKNSYLKNINNEIDSMPEFDIEWLLKTMATRDNLLPTANLYQTIIAVFLKSNNWSTLPAILSMMINVHSVYIDINLFKYIVVGIRDNYVKLETKRLRSNDPEMTHAIAQRRALKLFEKKCEDKIFIGVNTFKTSDNFKDLNDKNILDTLLVQILRLIKYQNPYDVNFGMVLEHFKTLEVNDEHMANIISLVNSNA